jgi:hypothetical protein
MNNEKLHGAPDRLLHNEIDWQHGQKLLQEFITAAGDYLFKNPVKPMIDPGGFHERLKRTFLTYNTWLSK